MVGDGGSHFSNSAWFLIIPGIVLTASCTCLASNFVIDAWLLFKCANTSFATHAYPHFVQMGNGNAGE
jgi:hypothetical protein